jgi:hypothetical protein
MLANVAMFLINVGVSYLLGRMSAPDGPRLENLGPQSGEYGVPMPRMFGEKVRAPGIMMAQGDINERKHKVKSGSALVGAATGAAIGAMYGGPVGLVIGAGLGFLAGSSAKQYYYTYDCTFALLFADRTSDEPIIGMEKIWANGKVIFSGSEAVVGSELDTDGKLIWKKYGKNRFFKSMTLYTGHSDQPVDPVLEDELGEDGGYPFSAYAVFEKLQLAQFGNGIPTDIAGLVQISAGQSLADVAEAICAAGDIDHLREVSTTALTSNYVRGYLINQESSCWDALKPLLPAFGVDAAEVAGQIRFYRRAQTMRATIPLDHMGAHAFGDSPPDRLSFKRSNDLALPQETALTFIDPDRDYQTNTMASQRTEGSAQSNVSVNLPLVLTADEGASAAALMHWDAWLGRTQVNFTLMDNWISLDAGLAYGVPFADQVLAYRVTRKTRGANGIIEVEALSDESVTYTASEVGTSGTLPPEEPTGFADTRLVFMDMPIFSDAHDEYGFYVAKAGTESYWDRGRIDISADDLTYATLIDDDGSAVIGDVTGTLAAGTTTGLDDTLDTTTVLTVVLEHSGMDLESITDAELDSWGNFAFVGKDGLGEYLQFKTATFVSGTTWQLTNLRRGRKGTDHAIGTHASGEVFVLLGEDGVMRVQYPSTDQWGDPVYLRGVSFNQDDADADVLSETNTGEGKRPYSPVNVEGTWDGSNNLTITWDSRSRLNAGGLGIDDNAEWDIEITSGTGRSDTVLAEAFAYSAADQITDGITPGDSIAGRVRQTSDVNDGRWRNFLLIGPDDARQLEDGLTFRHLEDGTTVRELG